MGINTTLVSAHSRSGIAGSRVEVHLSSLCKSYKSPCFTCGNQEEGEILAGSDIDLIVRCVSTTTSGATRNQALALLTAAGNLFPQKILSQVINIVSVIGTSVVTQVCSLSVLP